MIIKIAGYDPALANHGLAKGILDTDSGEFILEEMLLIKTASPKIKSVRKNSDDLERGRKAYRALKEFTSDVSIMCVEIPVGSQTARAMASYGMCIGILSGIDVPLIQVTAKEVKLGLSNKGSASKLDMIKAGIAEYPTAQWLTHKSKGVYEHNSKFYIADNEHLADAVGAIHAGVVTEQFAAIIAITK